MGAQTARSRSSDKSRKTTKSEKKITDADRLAFAEQLESHIQRNIADQPYEEIQDLLQYLKSLEAIQHLNRKEIPPSTEMAAVVLVLVLKTRTEQNISVEVLRTCEESGDWGNMSLISKEVAKQVFDLLVRHYALQVKNSQLIQRDAEILLTEALVNFKCSQGEMNFIKQFIIDRLSAQVKALRSQGKVGGSVSTNSYSQQFVSQQQQPQIMGKKNALKSNVMTKSAGKDSDLDYELYGIKPGTAANEFDMDEIVDEF